MKVSPTFFLLILLGSLGGTGVHAQFLPGSVSASILPSNPTSADNLKLVIGRPCSADLPYKANAYQVRMTQSHITVSLGEIVAGAVPGACPASPKDEIDLGRLPAGNYTITVNKSATAGTPSTNVVENAPFSVTDGRLLKTAPFVRLDYSGHWWDPADSGWGLFIWHDARDNLLGAWFTYMPNGTPMWYVFQPKWDTFASTSVADLMQTSRPPGPTSPPPTITTYTVVGTASLDFTNLGNVDEGKITYKLNSGTTLVRTIKRFKP